MTSLLTERQEDALRELVNLGGARAASMLARLVGDVGVLVDVPSVLSATSAQVGWLLGGRDVRVTAATFGIEGEVSGELWWVLREADAARLGRRLLARPGISGPLSSSAGAALSEAANICASACISQVGTLIHATLLPTPPRLREVSVEHLVETGEHEARTLLSSPFVATNAPAFGGWLMVMLDTGMTARALRRLGV